MLIFLANLCWVKSNAAFMKWNSRHIYILTHQPGLGVWQPKIVLEFEIEEECGHVKVSANRAKNPTYLSHSRIEL